MQEAFQNIFSSRLFSTRAGTLAVGLFAGVLALLIVLLYLSQYRSSLKASSAATPVLVVKSLIPRGTSWDVISGTGRFQPSTVPKKSLKEGAIADPDVLRGKVTVRDLYPGQQITFADFTAVAAAGLAAQITGRQRAITIPIDASHGLIGQAGPGDHVDVYLGFNGQTGGVNLPIIKILLQKVLVVGIGGGATAGIGGGAGGQGSTVTLRVTPRQAAQLAWGVENGTLWLVLRPSNGAKPTPPATITPQSLLGLKPVAVGP